MKEGGQRWIILSFSFGCASQSSVAVVAAAGDSNDATPTSTTQGMQKGSTIVKKSKHALGFSLPKPNMSRGIQRLIKRLKGVSQFFVYKDDIEEEELEMEIGYPTDVKHLTHIGWDGSTTITNSAVKGWENLTPSEIISFPSISLKQFELAMTAQAQAQAQAQGNVPTD